MFELDGFTQSDITAYENAFGLPHVPLQVILIDGFSGTPGDGAAEVTLDIELMIAMAPGVSSILVYEGPNSGQGLIDTYNRIATDNRAKSVSTSWGLPEDESTSSLLTAENQIFKQMATQGQILYAASGDSGAYDDGSALSVDDPASQPMVVGVGGTSLTTTSGGAYVSETTWSTGTGPGHNGGGGGISSVWSIPSWQVGAAGAGSLASTTMRNVPDVSFDADPNTGYAIYFEGQWLVFGGTSCAAPLWAAFTALVNQSLVAANKSALGFPNPTYYQLGESSFYSSTFHDINDHSTNGYYPAVTGYDLATGWGSFRGDALLSYLVGDDIVPPRCTRANPTVSITPTSQQGAAGASLTYTATITNNDNSACAASNFALSDTLPAGFSASLSAASVAISPGQHTTVSMVVRSAATSLAGTYSFSLTATNSSATTYKGTSSASYVVTSIVQTPTLLVAPRNAQFPYNSNGEALFYLRLLNGTTPVANQLLTISITGPVAEVYQVRTLADGSYDFALLLNQSIPIGNYAMTVSTVYGTSVLTQSVTFSVVQF